MRATRYSDLSNHELLSRLDQVIALERSNTAEMLALIAEVDERMLFLPAGYPSMVTYCEGKLGLSQDSAFKRIHVARAAQKFPAILDAVADGRLHLAGVYQLVPHLRLDNAEELLQAAEHKTKAEIRLMLARRFPRSESLPMAHRVPRTVASASHESVPAEEGQLVSSTVGESRDQLAPGQVHEQVARSRMEPIALERFELHLSMGQGTHDKLEYARDLLSHNDPSGDLASVIDRALDALIQRLEKQRFAAASKPRTGTTRTGRNAHGIPAHVRRAVWKRDGGACTFVGESGHRCGSRRLVQFDHRVPVARGGKSTVENVRLLCGPHNQLEAERVFGAGFMSEKRAGTRNAKRRRRTPPVTLQGSESATPVGVVVPDAPERWQAVDQHQRADAARAMDPSNAVPFDALQSRMRRL